jgi:hypothetical protein
VVFYAGCLIIWASKLQSQTALSTTEVEYIAMSMALCDVTPIMDLIQEMKERHIPVMCFKPYVYCKVIENNASALELAQLPKLPPCIKHINVCYHHFCEHVQKGLIKIFPVGISGQIADILTKAPRMKQLCTSPHPSVWRMAPQTTKVRECYILRYFGTYIPI